ncbi:putative ABC transporter ATP-binding protein YadG [BD1-7 clade bacterium]|nr:putative ABC transporter ATP-binding protein YadG [BD1-7 clade bacterium]
MSTLIQCQQLSKSYSGKQALKAATFECEAGAPIALVGPNGAGKTTLLSLICDYIRPTSGSLQVLGHKPGDSALFGQLSALPQDAQLDPAFSVRKQLALFAELQGFSVSSAKLEAARVLELMDLTDAATSLPGMLSHGMRKRVAIAQSLIGSPKLVLLDEPTAGLDPANARNIRQQIAKLSDETTFVISSHNLQDLERLCQTVLYLEQGELTQRDIHVVPDQNQQAFLTLQLMPGKLDAVIAALQQIAGVATVSESANNEILIAYNRQQISDMDIKVLQTLASNQWPYRALINGKTLEEQLFS